MQLAGTVTLKSCPCKHSRWLVSFAAFCPVRIIKENIPSKGTLYLGKPAHYSPPRNNFVKRRTTGKGNAINVLGRKYRMICRKPSALFNEFPFFDRFLLFFFFFFCRDACQTKCKKLEWGQKLLKLYFANIFCNIGISGEFWDSGESREFVGIVGKFR